MKSELKELIISLICGALIPAILFAIFPVRHEEKEKDKQDEYHDAQRQEEINDRISVLNEDGNVEDMELDAYLQSVILCEMPAEFELEALKAQAIVARTYTLRRVALGGKHDNAVVCTDSSCCQGFKSVQRYLAEGGQLEAVEKVRQAVALTDAIVLVYEGELIEATYFSCSGGMTEDAKAVWGTEIPYLQATDSPGEEKAAHYIDTVSVSVGEFAKALSIHPVGEPATWVENISLTAGGGVDKIVICGMEFKGTDIREKLNLRSTAFKITVVGQNVIITTKGFGHRVGMSQYGAEAMAVNGCTYQEILMHYYSGASLKTYPEV